MSGELLLKGIVAGHSSKNGVKIFQFILTEPPKAKDLWEDSGWRAGINLRPEELQYQKKSG